MKKITDENAKETILENDVVMISFTAEWCGPCKMLGPVIDGLSKDYEGRAVVAKMNVDENETTTNEYAIRSIPTILIFKNGELAEKMVGAQSKISYAERLDHYINQ